MNFQYSLFGAQSSTCWWSLSVSPAQLNVKHGGSDRTLPVDEAGWGEGIWDWRERLESWRKSTISSSSCCWSGTAEWAKRAWSSALLMITSTPRTFPPSVRFKEFLHAAEVFADISGSAVQTGFSDSLHVSTSPFSFFLFLFPLLCHVSDPLGSWRSTHLHSYLLLPSLFPEDWLNALMTSCTFVCRTLSVCLSALRETDRKVN